ncbi:adaptor protein MecA [Bacillus fonticola]|uniref:adaptor protein MecA n=1 Tax=Bacillus fonticola TaxID=2728853 RepID=UPI001475F6E4|nr:adaptor protein MecA [Bacillus fonticola]
MQFERLNPNQYKMFMTLEELQDRGISKEDVGGDSTKWFDLFHEVVTEACDTIGVEEEDSVAVEVYAVQPQGLFFIITVEEEPPFTLEGAISRHKYKETDSGTFVYQFTDFEHVLGLIPYGHCMATTHQSLYAKDNAYYLIVTFPSFRGYVEAHPILTEFGEKSSSSDAWIIEYGVCVCQQHAINQLSYWFSSEVR